MQWVLGAVSPGVKWQQNEADNSYTGSVEVVNGGAVSPHPHVHGMLRRQIPGIPSPFCMSFSVVGLHKLWVLGRHGACIIYDGTLLGFFPFLSSFCIHLSLFYPVLFF
jgi:hypothetical protein